MEKLLTVNDVCAVTGLKRSTIYAMIHHERIPVIKISGRCVRFRESDIQAWLESKLVDAKDKEPKEQVQLSRNTMKGSASVDEPTKKARGRGRVTKSFIDAIVEDAKREVLS